MPERLSEYKLKRIATESFKNGLRLHFDSILLYNNSSFPSAFHLSVLSLEEISKSNWVEHYFWSSKINNTPYDKSSEQKWLRLLHFHSEKQRAFFGWGAMFDYSPKFIDFIGRQGLEKKKQAATYVGLDRDKKGVDINSRISVPTRVTEKDSKQIISLISDYLKEVCSNNLTNKFYFDIEAKNDLLTPQLMSQLKEWKKNSGLKSQKWLSEWMKKINPQTL
jgi:AbiV family abortive infection protein